MELGLQTLGRFAQQSHSFYNRRRGAQQQGILANGATGTHFTGRFILSGQAESSIKAIFVTEEVRRGASQIIQSPLNLGHFAIQAVTFIQLVVQHTFVNGGGHHLHSKKDGANNHKNTKHRPRLEQDGRHMQGHRFR